MRRGRTGARGGLWRHKCLGLRMPLAVLRAGTTYEVRGPMTAVLWASGVVQGVGLAKTLRGRSAALSRELADRGGQIRSRHVFGPYLRIFFSGITQRPVLQEKGPPQGQGSYETTTNNKTNSWFCTGIQCPPQLHVYRASWQRCLEGFFIAYMDYEFVFD